ncbi:MAG: hypothetical protein JRG97_01860 [Deltaproteobacteria bacterium]|nr:hypothetical protein [Deltaproteobacteria bacterium]MBW2052356.1 hypothetical protein [Deltaproteobacteria bacterium]MBW2139801.1 hypothetical protein [Deltaproteobacteria bacterium]MBW2322850.1 hypothetical protein [Deltaproteobacteria bacterium]
MNPKIGKFNRLSGGNVILCLCLLGIIALVAFYDVPLFQVLKTYNVPGEVVPLAAADLDWVPSEHTADAIGV